MKEHFAHLAGQAVHTATGRAGAVLEPGLLSVHRTSAEPGGTVFSLAKTQLLLGAEKVVVIEAELFALLTQP